MSTSTLNRLLAHAAPAPSAQPPASVPPRLEEPVSSPVSQPDPAALLTAARLVLNAVNEVLYATLNANDAHAAAHVAATALQPDPLTASVSLPELIRHFLSDDERAILKAVANAPAGERITGVWVQRQTRMSVSDFWAIWSNLQVRGLIEQTGAGRKSGYALAVEWVRLLLN